LSRQWRFPDKPKPSEARLTVAPVDEIQLYVRADGTRTYVTLRELIERTNGATVTRADLHIGRSRDGELFITSRQDGMIRMLVPDSTGAPNRRFRFFLSLTLRGRCTLQRSCGFEDRLRRVGSARHSGDFTSAPIERARAHNVERSARHFWFGHQRQRVALGILKVRQPDFSIGQRGNLVRLRHTLVKSNIS
jgi:hypothetical protein